MAPFLHANALRFFLPIVLIYIAYACWVFCGKVKVGESYAL